MMKECDTEFKREAVKIKNEITGRFVYSIDA